MYNVIRLIFNTHKICDAGSYSIYLRVEPTLLNAMSFGVLFKLVLLKNIQWKKNSNTVCSQCIAAHLRFDGAWALQ